MKNLALLLLGVFGVYMATPKTMTLQAGKRYRYTVSVSPKLDDSLLNTLASALSSVGLQNIELFQNQKTTGAKFDGVTEQTTHDAHPGDLVTSAGSVSLYFVSAKEIP